MPLEGLVQPDDHHHLNAIIYGDTGVGKTQLAGSASDFEVMSPVLMIDVEGGSLTLSGKKIDIFRPEGWQDMQEVYNVLRNEDHGYQTVVIDSLTEIQRKLSLGFIMGELEEGADGYHDLSRTTPPDRQDWLRTGEQMRKFIRAFRDLAWQAREDRRVHVIMTALEKMDEKRRLICPEMPGKLGTGSGAFVDILGRLSVVPVEDDEGNVEERRHLLVTGYEDSRGTRYLAKNRGGRLGRQVWDPTAEKVFGVWMDDSDPEEKRRLQSAEAKRRRPILDDDEDDFEDEE